MRAFKCGFLAILLGFAAQPTTTWAQQAPPAAAVPATPAPAAPANVPPPPPPPPPEPEEKAEVKGFRSATWGMTEAQVKDAIKKDFGAARVTTEVNPADQTTLVWVNVDNLLPGAGMGRITYVFGYSSKKLIQVLVNWGGTVNPAMKPDAAIAVANLLRNHFASLVYKPDTMVQNAKLQDGMILVFRAFDQENRMTLVVLSEQTKQEGGPATAPIMLQLSYVQNIYNQDVFKVNKGQF